MASPLLLLLLGIASVVCYEDKPIPEYIASTPHHVFLKNLISQTNLTDQLSLSGPYTFFAPNDAAFAKLGGALNGYTNRQLRAILEYHVHEGFLMVAMVSAPRNYSTLLGDPIQIEPSQGTLLLNGRVNVSSADNDVIVNNGVVHTIDGVLLPPSELLTTLNIAEILIEQDNRFKDLFMALLLAELTTVLENESEDYTVFAPTDAAFVKYRDNLLHPDRANAKHIYTEVLKYHVIPGGRRAKDLQDGTLYTLHGTAVTIKINGTDVMVNDGHVIDSDIYACNGIIHAIDTLLIPDDIRQLSQQG